MTRVKKLLGPSLFVLLAIAAHAMPFTYFAAPVVLFLATWVCLRIDGRRLADLGLTFKRYRELGAGFAIGVGLFAAIALVRALLVGASWHFNAQAIIGVLSMGLAMVLLSVMFEELLFRGYAFDRLKPLAGAPITLVLSSLAFGAYHLIGRPYWAMGAVFQFALPALGGLIFGYALLRSRGMSLPIGLHWGGNFAVLCLFGWNLGGTGSTAVWTADVTMAQAHTLAAPDLLPQLPYLLSLAVMAALVWRARFKISYEGPSAP